MNDRWTRSSGTNAIKITTEERRRSNQDITEEDKLSRVAVLEDQPEQICSDSFIADPFVAIDVPCHARKLLFKVIQGHCDLFN
jgi:hypothetical protein